MTPSISVADLRQAFERLAERLEDQGVTQIDLADANYKWRIALGDSMNTSKEPRPILGDLCDDFDRLTNEPKQLDSISYNFVDSLASVIQFIAIGPSRRAL